MEGVFIQMPAGNYSFEEHIIQGTLGRHETFTPRYGWLKKGYEAVLKSEDVFKAKDAIERLGVGKNMVSSIRYWCQAFKLLEPNEKGKLEPSLLGQRLLGDNGWDPYLEDIASLWLLHWHLFVPRLEAVSWSLAFNKCNLWDFDIGLLANVIANSARLYPRFATISDNTFERDASCIIRMYCESYQERESEIECPFKQLGIIQQAAETNMVYFDVSEKDSLPPLIFAAACFSYLAHYVPKTQKTVALQRLTYDFNSPGIAFKVPESIVGSYLLKAFEKMDGVKLVDVMGTMQLHYEGEAMEHYWQALNKYYGEHN